jgi:arginyl-tRNA synthetase
MKAIDKTTIAEFLNKYLPQLTIEEIESVIEIPPPEIDYTYAFPCFKLTKWEKEKNPNTIALKLKNKIKLPEFLEQIEAKGPYLNLKVSAKYILNEIYSMKEDFGRIRLKLGLENEERLKIVIEYPSPNTNKPLHFGHVRNMLLGKSLSNLLKYKEHQVFQVNLYNNRGIHICKSMLAYKKWGKGKKPDKKGDHFVGDFYVLYSEKEKELINLDKEAHELLKLWEAGDKATISLWNEMNEWALDGFNETYKKLGIAFDKEYFESNLYLKGKEIIYEGLNRDIFEQLDDGAVIARLGEYNLEDKILIRRDGTAIYITQDIYLAYKKKEDFNYDKSIYVVADEQIQHFRWLFAILDKLGFKGDNFHLSYGMVDLPSGKMKSREGTVVDADDVIKEVEELAFREVEKRYTDITLVEKKKRAEIIGLAALKFYILKYNPAKGFIFNPEESISFEGETGPYIQYCYARIASIINKSNVEIGSKVNWELLKHEKELSLTKWLTYFPENINYSEKTYNIHLIAQYLLTLCQYFNSFYTSCQVISKDKELEYARLFLIKCVQIVIKIGLNILGIETLDQM